MITLLNHYLGIPLESLMKGNKDIQLETSKKEELMKNASIREYLAKKRNAVA
ncbi:MAG TPA: hypothetical protein VHO90_21615 [Bacteroidales bacterium]|nr:hypothetical protein [Bacteroidales bacterium]